MICPFTMAIVSGARECINGACPLYKYGSCGLIAAIEKYLTITIDVPDIPTPEPIYQEIKGKRIVRR